VGGSGTIKKQEPFDRLNIAITGPPILNLH